MIELVHLKRNYERHKAEIGRAVARVLSSGQYVLGEEVAAFEREFAVFCEAKHCVAVASGTDALLLSLKALGVGEGDEVITVANSFVSTALAVSLCGATPVFVDVEERTQLMDASLLGKRVTARTKGIIPVHLFGQPADMDAINAVARRHKLFVLEDACQAHGARYKGKRAGTLGDMAAFSFYPSKNLGGYGDGGAVVTNRKAFADKVRLYHSYGWKERYHSLAVGVNSRLDALQAAVLRVKLQHLPKWNETRRRLAMRYRELLTASGVRVTAEAQERESASHLFVIRSANRDALQAHLQAHGIGTAVHYPVPIHLQSVYAARGHMRGELPITERLAKEILSLPLCPDLTDKELAFVAKSVNEFGKTKK